MSPEARKRRADTTGIARVVERLADRLALGLRDPVLVGETPSGRDLTARRLLDSHVLALHRSSAGAEPSRARDLGSSVLRRSRP
jgi:hypothetical protein